MRALRGAAASSRGSTSGSTRVGPELLCGFLGFPRERRAEVASAYRDHMARAPVEVGGGLLLGAGRGGVCTVVFCSLGAVEAGEEAVAPLRALGPSLDAVAPNPYRAFQGMWDASNPFGVRAHSVAGRARAVGRRHRHRASPARTGPPRRSRTCSCGPSAGRARRRRAWAYECVGLWPPVPALDPGQVAWVDGFADAVDA